MKKVTAIFPGWLFPFVYCVAGVDAYPAYPFLLLTVTLHRIVEKRRGADNRPVVCAISAGGGIGLGGGLAADGTKGTINHLYSPVFYGMIGPYVCLLDYAIPSINRIRMVAT